MKKAKKQVRKLTPEQLELGAKYFAMSNLGWCGVRVETTKRGDQVLAVLDHFRKEIKDLRSLQMAVDAAWDQAVQGSMEGMMCGSYPRGISFEEEARYESKAIDGIEAEINSFRRELKSPKKRAYWIERLEKEVPFLFQEVSK